MKLHDDDSLTTAEFCSKILF